ncbi:Ser-Thr-rich glycosyl-phosphatidyl-inositol-anchored membrane family-domain-containing protein [Nemania sp. FL0031]|nr:Ser-Thr-rich glycosyl-phosphatidyl-inositol-anchored membrane family-domain-containing protein [Nemania sp. FL0031]
MRTATIFASVLAFAASALAQDATAGYAVISAPAKGEVVPAGKTYTIKWSAGKFSGPATISLMGGEDAGTLQILNPIATGVEVDNESYSWAVDCSLGEDKTYGIKIADEASEGATFQYSFPFAIKGPACSSTSSTSSVISVSATTSAVETSVTGYPVSTTSVVSTSSSIKNSTSTVVSSSSSVATPTTKKSTTYAVTSATTLATVSTPVVTVTSAASVTASGTSSTAATSTTASTTIPTAGATRAGAGLALGLFAAVLAL